jgi:hypothetical protein
LSFFLFFFKHSKKHRHDTYKKVQTLEKHKQRYDSSSEDDDHDHGRKQKHKHDSESDRQHHGHDKASKHRDNHGHEKHKHNKDRDVTVLFERKNWQVKSLAMGRCLKTFKTKGGFLI